MSSVHDSVGWRAGCDATRRDKDPFHSPTAWLRPQTWSRSSGTPSSCARVTPSRTPCARTAELAKGAANTYLGLKISFINGVADMCDAAGADLTVLATEWPEYRQANPQDLVDLPTTPVLVDCRTTLDPDPWRAAGWTVHQIGRPGK